MKSLFILISIAFSIGLSYHVQAQENRIEKDDLGEMKIPASAYYGIHTARNMKHFRMSHETMSDYSFLLKGIGIVKLAAAKANVESGILDKNKLTYIEKACQGIIYGGKRNQFELDVFQGDAAQSLNMAANEIIANAALEVQGIPKGNYKEIHPINDINLGQNAEANFATAVNIATVLQNEVLTVIVYQLIMALEKKSAQFEDENGELALKFNSYVNELNGNIAQLQITSSLLKFHFMGMDFENNHYNSEFAKECSRFINQKSQHTFVSAKKQTSLALNMNSMGLYSTSVRATAITLANITAYIISLSTEDANVPALIVLPMLPTEAKGTNNTAILALNQQICATVIGNDAASSAVSTIGHMPEVARQALMAKSILESQWLLVGSIELLNQQCLSGITLNKSR